MDWSHLQFAKDGKIELTPCFELVCASVAPLERAAEGLARFYAEFLRRFADKLTIYKTGTMTSWKKADARSLQMPTEWLSNSGNFEQSFGIQFHSGPSKIEMLPPSLRLVFKTGASYISMTAAPDFAETTDEPALDLLRKAVGQNFALSSGWAGYGVLWNTSMGPPSDEAQQKLRALIRRHPGLGQGDNFAIVDRAFHGISSANWLTLLGSELTAKKGGRNAIAGSLGPEITVHPLGEGVCIQAGPVPQLGDVNRGDDLPLYRKVGVFLKDIRTHEPPIFLDGLEGDATEEWLARFDR